jgi:uncharacterized protein (DUF924 family)
MAEALPERAQALIDFWFGPVVDPERESHRKIWFGGPPEFDDELRHLFLADYECAAAGAFGAWEAAPESALALVLLLDQIPRNIFRNTPRSYVTDALALAVADRALARGFDQAVPPAWRKFFYMPLHHSENVEDQRRSVLLFDSVREDHDPGDREERGGLRRYGLPYLEVIERFGRFPHRNAILGRTSTPEEIAFMETLKRSRSPVIASEAKQSPAD